MSDAALNQALVTAQVARDYTAVAAALQALSAANTVPSGSVEGQDLSAGALSTIAASSALTNAYGRILASPGADVDCGPAMQAALDARRVVDLDPGQSYYLATPVFLDSLDNSAKYIVNGHGATLVLGNALPTPSTWSAEIGAAPPTAFFNGTLRGALSGGSVSTDAAHGASSAPFGRRLVIRDLIVTSGSTAACLVYGGAASNGINGAATGLESCTLNGMLAGISWTGYADGNLADGCEIGTNPVSSATRLVYQRSAGDNTRIVECKAYGGFIADLAGSYGFQIESYISGQINVVASTGQISTGHQEASENASAIPWSINIDRSKVTIEDHYSWPSGSTSKYSIKIADSTTNPLYTASEVTIRDWRPATYYTSASTDSPRGPSLYIDALNPNGRVVVSGSRGVVLVAGTSVGYQGLRVNSADAAIQSALAAGADFIASGSWALSYNGSWNVGTASGAAPAPKRISAPTITTAAHGVMTGALTNGQAYEYVTAIKTAGGAYSALSSTSSLAAGAKQSMNLVVTNLVGPCTIAIWRKTGAGVTSAPDSYIEIGTDAYRSTWVDSGSNINGRPWQTSSIPVPNTVASTGLQYTFPSIDADSFVRKTANEVVNNSNTLQNDDHLFYPLVENGVYRFRLFVMYDASQAGDAKFAFTVPSGAALTFAQLGASTGATGNSGSVSYAAQTNSGSPAANVGGAAVATLLGYWGEGTVVVGSTPGNLQLQWAQATADATNLTVYAGSCMVVQRVA